MFMNTQETVLYEFDHFHIDVRELTLRRDGNAIPLESRIFNLLLVLVKNSNHLLTHDELLQAVWPDSSVEQGNVPRNISTLREVLGDTKTNSKFIQTVHGKGYRFIASVTKTEQPTVAVPTIHTFSNAPIQPTFTPTETNYKLTNRFKPTLSDHCGIWCVWCLSYMKVARNSKRDPPPC